MKKILLNESEKKAIISEREIAIIESFAKNYNKIKRLDEENFPTDDTPIDELLQRFKNSNEISDDKTALIEYIKMAKLRKWEAEIDDMEYHTNLWYGRLTAAEEKLAQLSSKNEMNEVDGEDYEQPSRGVEYGVDPYSEKPSLFDNVAKIYITRPEFNGSIMDMVYGIYIMYKDGKQEKIRSIDNFNQKFGTNIPSTRYPDDVVSYLETNHPEVSVYLDEFDVS